MLVAKGQYSEPSDPLRFKWRSAHFVSREISIAHCTFALTEAQH